jgi:transposase InsO family protein
MLAIIRGLEKWRHYLEGARHPVEIWTDHKNLEYFQVAQKLNRQQARWSLYLSRLDFTLHHKPGRTMGKLDALSRQADHGSGQGDNDNLTLIAPELFWIHALTGVRLEGEERNILREVRRSPNVDVQEESVAKAAMELWKDKSRGTIKSTEWSESEGLLMFRSKIYVPKDRDLRRHIVEQHHNKRITGHAGRFKTLELVARNHWWPQMSRYIGMYMKHCDLCNRNKVQHRRPMGELHPSETPDAPWDTISVDFIVELLESYGYDAIMSVVDSLTKCAHFIPTHTTINAEGTALLFLKEVWKHHGTPQVVVSNRGPQFVAAFTRELYKLLNIKQAMSTAYHPQMDRQTERVNQVLEGYLHIFTSQRQDNWDDFLPTGEFQYNNTVHSSTQQTPFMVDTGRHPHMGFEPQQPQSTLESANKFAERIALGIEEAKAALTKVKDEHAMFYNCRHEPALVYAPGDRVWLDGSDIATNRPSSKLSHRRLGLFVIEACVGHGAYCLKLPYQFRRLHPVFSTVKLSPAPPDPIIGWQPALPPPTTLVDGEEEYEVEAILDSQMRYNRLEYLLKFKGYDESHNQWEVHTHVYAKLKIALFHSKYPGAARHINAAIFDSIPFTRVDLATSWRSSHVVTPRFEGGVM